MSSSAKLPSLPKRSVNMDKKKPASNANPNANPNANGDEDSPDMRTLMTGSDGTPIFKRSWDPVFKKNGQHISGMRKPLPKPDTIAGKAYACYRKYADRYDAIVNSFHEEFTQQARADAEEAERQRLAAIQPPSIPESPRILASLEDLIDVCRSRVNNGKEKRVRKLIEDNELDINQNSKMYGGWTPLIAAARAGSYRTVRALCEDYAADVNLVEKHGWSALMHAANKGHLRVVKYLCEYRKADRLLKCKSRGWNALQYARKARHLEVSLYLSGDTPAATPRLMPYESELSLRSVMYPLHRRKIIEEAKFTVNCWCTNLSERCKKCAIKERDETQRKEDEERKAYLDFKRKEHERRERMWAGISLQEKAREKKIWGGLSSGDDSSSSSDESDMYKYD